MLHNYFIVAFRNMKRQFMYSFINILGLALGMACSLVIFLYAFGEWSYERHFKNSERIYRVSVSFFNMQFANGPAALREFLPKEFAGIEAFTGFRINNEELLRLDEKTFREVVYTVDSSFFKVFTYSFISGDPLTSLQQPQSLVMTKSTANKLFPQSNPIGKTILVGKDKVPHQVTGIVNDPEGNTHMKASVWVSVKPTTLTNVHWSSASVYSYVLLQKHSAQADLKNALDQIIAKHAYKASQSNKTLEEFINDPNAVKFNMMPLRDIYFKSRMFAEISQGGNETNMYIFSIIAVFILILGGVNFINLSTARATTRAKEIGIRKAMGTSRRKLIGQFLFESMITCLFAMVLALGLAELFTFAFQWITGQILTISVWTNGFGILSILLFALLIGLLAGIYPAFYLTAFKPVKVLKGNAQSGESRSLRNALVVCQFAIAVGLIICAIAIVRQLNYMSGKDLGFHQENVLTIENIKILGNSVDAFKEKLLQLPEVKQACVHAGEPGNKNSVSLFKFKTPTLPEEITMNIYYTADEHFMDVMGFRLLSGRNFNKDLASDTASVILNESAVKALDLGDNPLGAEFTNGMKVIGVVSDFHWESLRNNIAPLAIGYGNYGWPSLSLRLHAQTDADVIRSVEQEWKNIAPDEVLEYHFLEDNFGKLLEKEKTLSKAIVSFTGLAVIISCLGLFGLAAFTTSQRTKEIGVRKVMGASVANIVSMLTSQFTRLVLLAIAIAVPISYYATEQWLSGFAFRTPLSWWIFALGGLAAIFVSLITIAFHTLRAAQTNPAETLKHE